MRRLSNWKVAGIIAGALLLLGLAFALSIRSTADAAWKAMQERKWALIAEARARPTARPVLRGTAEPGNAWTDYEAALSLMKTLGVNRQVLQAYLARATNADAAAVQKIVAAHTVTLDFLRRGVRRAEASYPYEWERGSSFDTPPLLRTQELAMLATAQARLLRESGRIRDAAELLLDVAQFSGDIRRNGVLISDMIGIANLSLALDELRDLLAASPNAEDLAAIDRELATLDRDWPDFTVSIRNETMATQTTLVADDALGSPDGPPFLEAWRFGFSRRLMFADAAAACGRSLELFIAQESLPWLERVKAGEDSKRVSETSNNPLVRGFAYSFVIAHSSVHQRHAQLRLLRMATRFRLDGTVAELRDPYGAQLKHAVSGGRLKAWSVGRDGIDNGGKGEWGRNDPGNDIALEIER